MSTYTNNLNLIKPDYDDDIDVQHINNNMDVLDTQVQAVKDVNDNQNVRLTKLENKTYPYLPLTGGTVTGDLTVTGNIEGKTGGHLLDGQTVTRIDDNSLLIKHSDGTFEWYYRTNSTGSTSLEITLPLPAKNNLYYVTIGMYDKYRSIMNVVNVMYDDNNKPTSTSFKIRQLNTNGDSRDDSFMIYVRGEY